MLINNIATIFIQTPVLAMSLIFKYPEPNTIALGGVATGSINAHDAAMVHAAIKTKGCSPTDMPRGARIGNIIEVVAKLEVISVRKFIALTKIRSIKNRSMLFSPLN